jgi:hypothetical protein
LAVLDPALEVVEDDEPEEEPEELEVLDEEVPEESPEPDLSDDFSDEPLVAASTRPLPERLSVR